MSHFSRRNGQLYIDNIALADLAIQHGTPAYVYSKEAISEQFLAYQQAMGEQPQLICYAVKANCSLAILNVLAKLGAGFDIVSGGELERVLAAGGQPQRIVFSGVGKSHDEITLALKTGIHCFNVESTAELERIQDIAQGLDIVAPISIRVNPDVDAGTHPYISTGLKENKFGIDIDSVSAVYQRAAALSHLAIKGVDCHIGSQLTEIAPFIDAMDRVLLLIDHLAEKGITIEHLDLGGGLGVRYQDEQPPAIGDYIHAIRQRLGTRDLRLILEPGRSIVANAGVLLTRVEYLKNAGDKNFAIVDAAMNDMLRPALYEAWLDIETVSENKQANTAIYDIVGPVCETGDFLGKQRSLAIGEGDLLCIHSAGAYGMSMSSNYNSRPRAVEIMVDDSKAHLIKARETNADLMRGESLLPDPC
ncbi:MAG: diaminopimelate decarboxylase [Gammaproteobacteria bacterium]|nr:diaminopimelate decarboxylase [Gammaproteobacteria bacterium]MBQ0838434.1 diaminopimelate decarboxylase [Gammaproteobacteria bacterium]